MKKKTFYTEAAYLIGLAVLALGTALMERANFGVSMIVAPAYLFYRKLNPLLPFFSFGMAEYLLQLVLLVLLTLILRKGKLSYLFSFVTAVIYGFMLDGCMALVALVPGTGYALRIAFYLLGMVACSIGVSLLFKPYIPPEAYELFVKEIAAKLGKPIPRVKTIYDCASCLISILLSFAFFGFGVFEGVKLGTIICALVNGWMIGWFSCLWDQKYIFADALKLRTLFEAK